MGETLAEHQFGPYRIGALLGRGGMGEVHRAFDTVHEREVALKRLVGTAGAVYRTRFRREAQLVARLGHPHIVPLHAHGEIDGVLYLDMRLIEGPNLERVLADGPLEPLRAVRILGQVAAALDAAHAAGVLHRDVKPANILLGSADRVDGADDTEEAAFLADFGIATAFSPDITRLTATGAPIGTLAYMAPERLMQTKSGAPDSGQSDVYSLACVLFQCLTGRVPFPADDAVGTFAAHVNAPPPAPSLFDRRIPHAMDLVIRTGMDKDPRRRYPTPGELMSAAAAVLQARPGAPSDTVPETDGDSGRNHFVQLLMNVRRARESPPTIDPEAPDRCPYPGLASFGVEDSSWFFGREQEVGDLLVRLSGIRRDSGPLLVVGASGAGKSSLLGAGLLAAHTAAGGQALALTPGERPIDTLAARLAAHIGADPAVLADRLRATPTAFGELCQRLHGPALVAVDQFEELFTQCADDAERVAFTTALAAAWPARVILAVRADFVEQCIGLPALRSALDAPFVLGPLRGDELSRVITEPAVACGLAVEPALVERLIADIGARDGADHDPGALPRLAHALRETWRHGGGDLLTLEDYQRTGGVDRAVALSAEGVYTRLDDPDRQALRASMLRMVTLLDGGGIARRRAARSELPAEILERLVAARLVTVDRDTVLPAHDALLIAWPRLREWVAEDRAGLLIHQRLSEAATAWQAGGRDRGDLYRGARLGAALDWAAGRTDLTPAEQAFLAASERDQRRGTRRLRGLVAALATLLVIALVAGGLLVISRNETLSRQLAAESLAQSTIDPVGAMRKALEAWRASPTVEARGALLSAAMLSYPASIDTGLDMAAVVDVSPDGNLIAAGDLDGHVVIWDVERRKPLDIDLPGLGGSVAAVRFSSDGTLLATSAFGSGDDEGKVQIWDVASGRLVSQPEHGLPAVGWVAWRPDGQALAAFTVRDEGNGGVIAVGQWDPRSGRFLGWAATDVPDASSIAYSPDGTRLAIGRGDGSVELWDPATTTRISRHTDHAQTGVQTDDGTIPVHVAFSSDLLASASLLDSTMRFWDPHTGALIREARDIILNSPTPDGPRGPSAIAFRPDGSELLTNSDAGAVTAWDPLTGRYQRTISAGPTTAAPSNGAVLAIAASADSRTIVAATADGTVLRWQDNTDWYNRPTGAVTSLAFVSGDDLLTAGDADGRLHTWAVEDGEPVVAAVALDAGVLGIDYTRDGLRVVGTADARFILTPPGGGPGTSRTISLPDRVFSTGAMAASPDGRWLAAADAGRALRGQFDDNRIRVWDTATLTERAVVELGSELPTELIFADDGARLIALTTRDNGLGVDEEASGEPAGAALITWQAPEFDEPYRIPLGSEDLITAALTPDGNTLVTAGSSGTIQLRDPETGELRAEFGAHPAPVRALAVSPDGRTVATATTADAIVRLWSLPGRELVAQLRGHESDLNEVVYSPDSRRLATGGTDTNVAVWTVQPADAIEQICANLADAGESNLDDLGC